MNADEKHVIELVESDKKLSDKVKTISQESLKVLKGALTKFAINHEQGGIIPSRVLSEIPSKKDKAIIEELIQVAEFESGSESEMMVQGAANTWKSNNAAFIMAVVTIVIADLLSKTSDEQDNTDTEQRRALVHHMFGKEGYLHGKMTEDEALKQIQPANEFVTEDGKMLDSANYQYATWLIGGIYGHVVSTIKQNPTSSQFHSEMGVDDVQGAIVSDGDALDAKKRHASDGITGFVDLYNMKTMMLFRTVSAQAHSEGTRSIGTILRFKYAIIINEYGACKLCQQYLDRVMTVEAACDMIPQHYCCRCQVKIMYRHTLTDDEDVDDDDLIDNEDDDEEDDY